MHHLNERIAASVYFAPEVHDAFEALGFGGSGGEFNGVAGPNSEAYFSSRGACMGAVTGNVVAAAFGVFNPAVVAPTVEAAWKIASPEQLLEARMRGQSAFLTRALTSNISDIARATELLKRGADACQHAGRHLFSGLASQGFPGDPIGDLWRASDLVREHRGDCHIIAWTAEGLSAAEMMLLTELWWGLPRRSYSLTRAWTPEQYDAADNELAERGWVIDDQLTEAGRAAREAIESVTDAQEHRVLAALGDDIDELIELLTPMASDITARKGYPGSIDG
ncbi:MAG: hypothetical protein ACI8Y4_003717 [Candidatus Poriferisodalaceae bacterium]|jgi:hypothetical protein